MTKSRADDLRRLPIQECDVLLHEAGAPPIHTPLSVLQSLPQEVRDRLYVVHTAAIPADSGLRVAPTGTAGTIRLDRHQPSSSNEGICSVPSSSVKASFEGRGNDTLSVESEQNTPRRSSRPESGKVGSLLKKWEKNVADRVLSPIQKPKESVPPFSAESLQDGGYPNLTVLGQYHAGMGCDLSKQFSGKDGTQKVVPLVFLRPTCVSDAWFILNLLSAVPFFSR